MSLLRNTVARIRDKHKTSYIFCYTLPDISDLEFSDAAGDGVPQGNLSGDGGGIVGHLHLRYSQRVNTLQLQFRDPHWNIMISVST